MFFKSTSENSYKVQILESVKCFYIFLPSQSSIVTMFLVSRRYKMFLYTSGEEGWSCYSYKVAGP